MSFISFGHVEGDQIHALMDGESIGGGTVGGSVGASEYDQVFCVRELEGYDTFIEAELWRMLHDASGVSDDLVEGPLYFSAVCLLFQVVAPHAQNVFEKIHVNN